ncbi:hypothetical protein GCM10010315_34700 [Streptomyces luteosporeus]|uniref:NAD-dependent epimerase/dehydratase family protein n=1 Tax=Streptomyces luteosporeus TaxID=173856 RepID=A0ABP6GC52_9ACTN
MVTGAAGPLGSAVSRRLRRTEGRLLRTDVEDADAGEEAFRARLEHFLATATRAELYHAAGFTAADRRVVPVTHAAAHAFAETARTLGVPACLTFFTSAGGDAAHDRAMAAVEALARRFATEYAPAHITTRVAALGPLTAPMDDIARAVVALAGPEFDLATGATLPLSAHPHA